jgi:FMN phosphatase YigB (HAD superfamily)
MAISAVIFDADGVVIFPWRFARYLEQEFNITREMTRGFFRGLSEIFDRLFFSHRLGCQKPDHDFYRLIEEALGLEGPEILFWDDAAVNVRAARERVWNAEVYVGFEGFQRKLAAYVERQ